MAIAVLGLALAGYLAFGWAVLVRLGALDHPVRIGMGCVVLATLWVAAQKKPFAITLLLLALFPLFGNHPGGRFVEVINLLVAASAGGLIAEARREHRLPPGGAIWRIAGVYLLTAIVALVPTLPSLAVHAAQINDPILLVAQAITAAEDNPLYSVSSIVLVTLAFVWAFALSWAEVPPRFPRQAYRILTIGLFTVTAVGISDYVGLTSVGRFYMQSIDARAVHLVGLQSLFWDPGWFAWYFVMTFAIAVGLRTIERGRMRWLVSSGIVFCYVSFFLNSQRAGLLAVHLVLLLWVWYSCRTTAQPVPSYAGPFAALGLVLLLATVVSVPAVRDTVARAQLLSLERSINTAVDLLRTDEGGRRWPSERPKLWSAALLMWRDAPVFGIGEGSFAWRFRDYVPAGSTLDTFSHGDAHSTWFQLLATRGIVGVTVFALLVLAVARALWVRWQHPVDGPVVTAPILSLAGFVTYSFVSALFYLQPMQLLFWMIVAIAAAPATQSPRSGRFKYAVAVGFTSAIVIQLVMTRPLVANASAILARQPRGFYPVEYGPRGVPMRWSSASGVLCLNPDAVRVRLRFAVIDPRVATLPRRVALYLDGREVDRFEITTSDIVTRVFELEPASASANRANSGQVVAFGECTSESRRLQVAVDRTWSPADTGFGTDPRRLGVLVFEPTYLH